MPKNWEIFELGDLCDDISYVYTESASKEEIGPKFLRITDIQNDFINWIDVPYCKISDKDLKKYQSRNWRYRNCENRKFYRSYFLN